MMNGRPFFSNRILNECFLFDKKIQFEKNSSIQAMLVTGLQE